MQLQRLREVDDVRLAEAAKGAQDGQVTQFLAGVPELLARYRNAPPAAAALIHAAMDACRLGMRNALSYGFLEATASRYLADADWDLLADDWMDQALAYNGTPCNGVRGPLTLIRSRAARAADPPIGVGPTYRLADYLDQYGRSARCGELPPSAFWMAATSYADPGDLGALGGAARARGLYRDAAQFCKDACAHGDASAAFLLIHDFAILHPTDHHPARWAAAHAALDNPGDVARLLDALWEAGADEEFEMLLSRDPATNVALDDLYAVTDLLDVLREADAEEQFAQLADRVAAHAPLEFVYDVAYLLRHLRDAGEEEYFTALAARAAATAPIDNPYAVADLLDELREARENEYVTALADRAAAHLPLKNPRDAAHLLGKLRRAGMREQFDVLADRAATHAFVEDPYAVAGLLRALREADAQKQAQVLGGRAAAHTALDDPEHLISLLRELRESRAWMELTALAARAAAHVYVDDPYAVATLLRALRGVGAKQQANVLLPAIPLPTPPSITRSPWPP